MNIQNIWQTDTKFKEEEKSFTISIDVNEHYSNLIGFYVIRWCLFCFNFFLIHNPKTCYMRSCVRACVGAQVLECFQL